MKIVIMSLLTAVAFLTASFFTCFAAPAATEDRENSNEKILEQGHEINEDTGEPTEDYDEEDMEDRQEDQEYEEDEIREPDENIIDDTDKPMRDYEDEDIEKPGDKEEPPDPDADKA